MAERPDHATSPSARQALISAALAEIMEHGVNGLRVHRVCETAGVTTGALYFHFGNREGLACEAIYERFVELSRGSFDEIKRLQRSDLQGDEFYEAYLQPHRFVFRPIQAEFRRIRAEAILLAQSNESFRQRLTTIERQFFEEHRLLIQSSADAGRLAPRHDITATAAFFFAFGFGLIALDNLGMDSFDTEKIIAVLGEVFRALDTK